MAYKDRLEIERDPSRYSGIKFYVRIARLYEDGTKKNVLHEVFQGKERHKALARFEELKRQHPGIETLKDIERQRWEK